MKNNVYNLTLNESKEFLKNENCIEFLENGLTDEFSPQWDDLARLYILIRNRKPFQVLEFGSGFSTLVIAFALKKNWEDYLSLISSKGIDEKDLTFNKPRLYSLESSEKWMKNTMKKIKDASFEAFTEINYSRVVISEYMGQICYFYKNLPDIVPDFVYLDGPDPSTVEGKINGLSFKNIQRTVMAADILKYESTLLPGFFMIVDGRSNNSRFLKRMLKREYEINYHLNADVTTFKLKEERLGRKNIFGWEAYNGDDVHFAGEKIN